MSSSNPFLLPIKEELNEFNSYFSAEMKGNTWLLNVVTRYILKTKGKQLRPAMVFLSAKLNGTINPSTYRAAALIELMHTATLVHDDVVDESYQRRGFFSINALWKNKIAVLVGDYLLARGLMLAVKNKEFELLGILSSAVENMSEGELLQIEKSKFLNITEEIYYEIIRKKTAVLIAACAAAGARSVKNEDAAVEQMRLFGENLGMAFQIKDDLFDYQEESITGKPSGNDLKEKKLTLPLIYALSNVSWLEKRKYLSLIKNHHNNPERMKQVVNFVKEKGGIEYSTGKMYYYKQQAISILQNYPESEIKTAMLQLAEYITERKK